MKEELRKVLKLPTESESYVTGLPENQIPFYLDYYYTIENNNLLVVTANIYDANKMYNQLSFYNKNVLLFPMDDFVVTESLVFSPDLTQIRIKTLCELLNTDSKKIVVTNLTGYLKFLSSKNTFNNSIIQLKKDITLSKEELLQKLSTIGYRRKTIVEEEGTFASRGYILDIYPFNSKNPIRVEFWDDTIDSIRTFNIENQLSIKTLESVDIYPCTEIVEKGNKDSIVNYIDNPTVVYSNYSKLMQEYNELLVQSDAYEKEYNKKYMYHLDEIKTNKKVYIELFDNVDTNFNNINIGIKKISLSALNFLEKKDFLYRLLDNNKKVILCLNNEKYIKKIFSEFEDRSLITDLENTFDKKINIIKKCLIESFSFNNIYFIAGNEFFSDDLVNVESPQVNNNVVKRKIKLDEVNNGDYVVHKLYGIGIYRGIKTLTKNKLQKDYLQIDYKNNDKLYIPVENIKYISKFSSKEGMTPTLNKLGTSDWEKTKQSVRKKICDISDRLLKVSAGREKCIGYSFKSYPDLEYEFERDFSHELTPGQKKSMLEIKIDMEKQTPMDRLLCGDVGFGKTELALRAAFKAIANGKQVAYLCPTTILSKQQYESAVKRFSNFSVNIRLMNRFTSSREVTDILTELKEGKVDFLIGTHKLLNSKIVYKDLGLLIIDEEQRFGVLQKEMIKEYKNTVDVLTLSATPIPRTLQMSLTGLKKISLIDTPPVNRYPVQTYVIEENDLVIKEAIRKELARKGQCFVLYNNVEKIIDKMNKLKILVPEARICYSHGQMDKKDIENVMEDFINHKYDVLLCTTIIETGIDIPNVNTLIIYEADKFGLSQLYQIRGRVGRSNKIAFSYLMYNKTKVLSDIASKRLMAIKEFTELGSGFSIAMRDLSIRGAGDILGSEQAGFIDSVGYNLYLEMLQEEIKKLKGEKVEEEKVEDKVLLEVSTHINSEYVNEESIKIEIHKKIDGVNSEDDIKILLKELSDRFGKVPDNIIIYMYEKYLEKIVKRADYLRLSALKNKFEIIINEEMSNLLDVKELFYYMYNVDKSFKVSYSFKRIVISIPNVELNLSLVIKIIDIVSYVCKSLENQNLK